MREKIRFAAIVLLSASLVLAFVFYADGIKREIDRAPYLVDHLTLTAVKEDFEVLESYPNLKEVDMTGSEHYDKIIQYIADHPDVDVIYTVKLADQVIGNDETSIKLEPGQFDYADLMEKLAYLPGIEKIELKKTDLSPDQIFGISESYPHITVDYSKVICGQECTKDTSEIDLSFISSEELPSVLEQMKLIPNLSSINLMDSEGNSTLGQEDVKCLLEAAPNAQIRYQFELFGKTLSCQDETVEYVNIPVGDEGEQQIRSALDIMPNCTYFKLDNCGVSNEVMASIRDDYPDKKIVWRVFFGRTFSALTDETVIRATHQLNDNNISQMHYLTDVVYMDIGHNDPLTDISFCANMPNLKLLIVSGSAITTADGLAGLKNLEFAEFCFCGYMTDISALESCTGLKFLNISATRVSDLTPLKDLKLERFNCLRIPSVSSRSKAAFIEEHPDCLSVFEGRQPYGYGWRYSDRGYTFLEYYATMRKIFHYDDASLGNGYEWEIVTQNDPW